MPFYGRGIDVISGFIDYRNLVNNNGELGIIGRNGEVTMLEGYKELWDEDAQAPYWVDAEGKFILTYEIPRSIAIKCEWLKEKGMLGAMYWDYNGDDDEGTLQKAVYNGVMGK